MKILTTIVLFVILSVAYGQTEFQADSRIIKNLGEEKTQELVQFRPNLYNYYVFQLNHTCTIVSSQDTKNDSKLKSKFKNEAGENLSSEELNKEYFNFKEWGIEPDQEETRYYKLKDGSVLKVLSIRALTNEFRISPKNTKYLY
ncbi:MAG: hypothetical protein R2799_04590 [Crocinitomicaceae bacterium]